MRHLERLGRFFAVLGAFLLSGFLAHQFGPGGLWKGYDASLAMAQAGAPRQYDLTRLEAVNETLKYVRNRYVDPDRVRPRDMLLSALNSIQRDVAQVIVLPDENGQVSIRVETHEKRLKVDNVLGPWDVSTKLREVFGFLQRHLAGSGVDLRSIEYAACNGILNTLDPHSSFLSPEAYREMNLSTSGHFGGLGIVISIRDQLLTVIRPMPGTPAGEAGLKRYDRVMKIGDESTLNMPLDDAVRRLRGEPGSKITIAVQRDGAWEGLKDFELTRERIRVRSVLSERLAGNVGYLRLKAFQSKSTIEISEALDAMRAEGPLEGLVLDLRGNPGGLLEQAAKVSDLFLRRGTIVATVGHSEGREEKRARDDGTEPPYPMVVLVNGQSASASEIVAGAIKNLDRGLIVGQTTFGKGSVQLVFPEVTSDKAALKLTIAQYLTPGDQSIQGVGVTPHIELDPMTPDDLEMDLTVQDDGVKERDLSQSLSNEKAAEPGKPDEVVRFYLSRDERMELRERGGELDDVFQMDFAVAFARDLVRRLPKGQAAGAQLAAAKAHIESVRERELGKVAADLQRLGIDWAVPDERPVEGPAHEDFDVTVRTDRPQDTVRAGESMQLEVTVKNNGALPVYRLRAVTESDNGYFDEKELVFGKVGPGETKRATTPLSWCEIDGKKPGSTKPTPENAKRVCKIPMDALSRSDGIKIHFDALGGYTPRSAELRPTIVALDRPLFQYSYQIADDVNGNGDGLIQRGERASIYLRVKNVGQGPSHESQANLANRSGSGVLLRKGRFDISNMAPGDVRDVVFTFDAGAGLEDNEVILSLTVGDRDLREFATEKIRIPVKPAVKIGPATGDATTTSPAPLFGAADGSRGAFGRLPPGAIVTRVGETGAFTKVRLPGGREAFVETRHLRDGGKATADTGAWVTLYGHAPPGLVVNAATMATREDRVRIDVEATDDERLLDTYLFVGSRKLFYQSNRNGADPTRARFTFDAPLKPGVNVITVVARENPDTTTRRVVVVRRDGKNGEILKTPKHDEGYLQEAFGEN
ncbi:MAG: MXAN_5808 family serine peptidase [Myxococcota bacterium]